MKRLFNFPYLRIKAYSHYILNANKNMWNGPRAK